MISTLHNAVTIHKLSVCLKRKARVKVKDQPFPKDHMTMRLVKEMKFLKYSMLNSSKIFHSISQPAGSPRSP